MFKLYHLIRNKKDIKSISLQLKEKDENNRKHNFKMLQEFCPELFEG